MRPSPEQALNSYYTAVHEAPVPSTVLVRTEKPTRDATIGAAAGLILLLFMIGLSAEIEVPENAPPIIGAEAYAQLYRSEPPRTRTEQTQGETWKTKLA